MRRQLITFASVAALLAVSFLLVPGAPATVQDTFQKLAQVRSQLVETKAELGMYSCCIAPTCNFCALASGMCPCGDNVDTEKGVCGECYLGWKAGQGNVAGVAADDVQPMSGDMLEEMYQMRAESTPDATAGRGSHRHQHRARR